MAEEIRAQYQWAVYRQSEDGEISVSVGINKGENAEQKRGYFVDATPGLDGDQKDARDQRIARELVLRGLVILEHGRTRNPAFDSPQEKTTSIFAVRPCANDEEAESLVGLIAEILEGLGADALPPKDAKIEIK